MILVLVLAMLANSAQPPLQNTPGSDPVYPDTQNPPIQRPSVPNMPLAIPSGPNLPVLVPADSRNAIPFILIFVDFRDFMCPACLDSLLNVCRSIPRHLLETRVMGIVQLDGANTFSPRRIKIAQKKIRGFVHANRIVFPMLLDKYSSARPPEAAHTQIWVLSNASQELIRFELPLSAADINTLCRIVHIP